MNTHDELCAAITANNLDLARQLAHLIQTHRSQLYYNLGHEIIDIRAMLARSLNLNQPFFRLAATRLVATSSNDHKHPWGTANDNTRAPFFVTACEQVIGRRPLSYLDLGCSGGGLVFDFLLAGHRAFGIEGSDYSQRSQRAEWRVIPNALATGDITEPFQVSNVSTGEQSVFDIITMWEVFEHIPEAAIPQLMHNVRRHAAPDGLVVASIALRDDIVNGISYHATVKPYDWWRATFHRLGWVCHDYEFIPRQAHCRGVGNGPLDPNYEQDPSCGFHITLTLSAK